MRRNIFRTIAVLAVVSFLQSCSDQQSASEYVGSISVIPEPAQMVQGKGQFVLNKETRVLVEKSSGALKKIAESFAGKLSIATGYTISVEEADEKGSEAENAIFLTTVGASDTLGKEGYQLDVTNQRAIVKASAPNGIFYGVQTLLQLLPSAIDGSAITEGVLWSIPAVTITDAPRYQWRGLHLDVSRHFSSVEFVKEYLDNMAMHKLNTFHWHLTDDQGWRIEIKKYPKLTEIGAWRDGTLIGHAGSTEFDTIRYGGFYTQEEIKEVVAYAKDRFITVVPEIEMPGHATAAVAAYPEVGVTGKRPEVVKEWGVFLDIYGVEDNTFEFLEDVLTEVIELFPSKYIHIGGDEAWKDQWEESSVVQAKIKELGLKDEHELQSWFITRIEKFVNSKGRQIIGWDEILEGGLAPNAAVMSWRGEEGGIAAAKDEHYVVMSPGSHLYLDHFQGDPMFEPLQIHGYTTIEKLYSYNPTPAALTSDEQQYILGAQANVWSEYLENDDKIEYVVFPRLAALSEVLWSPLEKKDWSTFQTKIPEQLERYEYLDINYAKSIYFVTYDVELDSATSKYRVMLQNQFDLDGMHYTLDGTDPDQSSPVYEAALELEEGAVLKAVLYDEAGPKAKVTEITLSPDLVKKK